MASSVEPLLVVELLFRSKHGFTDLSHVVTVASLFLDSSVELPLHRACRFQSIRLLDRIVTSGKNWKRHKSRTSCPFRTLLQTDPHYAQYQFTRSLKNAIAHKNLEMVKWLSTKFQGQKVTEEVVSQAAGLGSIEILQFFHDNDNQEVGRQLREANRRCVAGHAVEWGGASMAEAIASSHTDVVWWLHQHINDGEFDMSAALKAAILAGNILVAEWLLGCGAEWPLDVPGEFLAHDVVAQGRLDILRWLEDQDQLQGLHGLVVKAAEHGHLRIVRWLIDGDADQPGISIRTTDLGGEARIAIHAAAMGGHLEVAQYLHARAKAPENDVQRELQALERQKTLRRVRKYLEPSKLVDRTSAKTMVGAAANGFLDVVQWMYDNSGALFSQNGNFFGFRTSGVPTTYAMDVAAGGGHLDLVKYLHELQLSVDDGSRKRKRDDPAKRTRPKCSRAAMDGAAANGHLDVVQWLHHIRRDGCTTSAMDSAATAGRMDIIQWLHEHRSEGCSAEAMDGAATNGHLQIVQWLHKNSSSGCTTKAMDGAATNGHVEVVRWLHENRSEGCTTDAMDGAAEHGALDIVKWLHRNRTEGCTTKAMDLAAENGHLHVVRWLHNHRSEGCSTAAIDGPAANNYFEVFLYLHSVCARRCTAETAEVATDEAPDIEAWILRRYPALRGQREQ